MKYEILGGGHVTAATDLGLVQALRQDSQAWAPSVGIEDFMEGMADRCRTQKGVTVRTNGIANFVADLKEHGFISQASE
ncbi:hypothetical protein [Hymenobacter nivis]|uniref:Uncharacterized protein n=1 Tax=Hymenobacter nivis TaxID=1850093 RepID=A0A502HB56_9BACT|nr:hypothetical protein [Hymenobacter nivis]TPG71979.1 hypothetical protein EAH73_01670 [Hymenobacter nivis]